MSFFTDVSKGLDSAVDWMQDAVNDAVDAGQKGLEGAVDALQEGANHLVDCGQEVIADGAELLEDLFAQADQTPCPPTGPSDTQLVDELVALLEGAMAWVKDAASSAPVHHPDLPCVSVGPHPAVTGTDGPSHSLGLPDLSGLDPMTALFVILSYLQAELGKKVEVLGAVSGIKAELLDAKAKDALKGPGVTVNYDAAIKDLEENFSSQLAELGLVDGDGKATIDLDALTAAESMLTQQVQQMEQFRQQLNTMASNLSRSDHEAKMVSLRNIPTR